MLLGLSEDQGKNSIVSVGKQGHCRDKDGLEGQNQSRLMLLPREFFSGALGIVHIVPLPRIFLFNPYLVWFIYFKYDITALTCFLRHFFRITGFGNNLLQVVIIWLNGVSNVKLILAAYMNNTCKLFLFLLGVIRSRYVHKPKLVWFREGNGHNSLCSICSKLSSNEIQ